MTLFDPKGNVLRGREVDKQLADAQLEQERAQPASLEEDLTKAKRDGRSEDETRLLDTMLLLRGMPGIDDPELVPRLAALFGTHEALVEAMSEVDESKRYEMYTALRTHLPFKAHPLDWYEARIYEMASAGASRYAPVEIGDKKYQPVPAELADKVMLIFSCYKCTRVERFIGETAVATAVEARKKGWVRDLAVNKEVCPKCPAYRQKFGRA